MNIIVANPPNIEAIVAVFPACLKQPTLFAFGTAIFNPGNIKIDDSLMAHEKVHGARQIEKGVETWWAEYLVSAEFRLAEELPAHRAEYRSVCERLGMTRNLRRIHLRNIARRLARPLYGRLVTHHEAKRLIGGRDA